jgi:hypothetical protein
MAYVFPETAAQALCQSLEPAEWRTLLDGEVGRKINNLVAGAECVISTGTAQVQLSMRQMNLGPASRTEQVDGHKATLIDGRSVAAASVAAFPLGERDEREQQAAQANPVLYVTAGTVDPRQERPGLLKIVRGVVSKVLPKVSSNKPKTPAADSAGKVKFAVTERQAGVALTDLPPAAQSLVLCSAVVKLAGPKPAMDKVRVNSIGECEYIGEGVFVRVDKYGKLCGSGDQTVAGRKARLSDDGVSVELIELPATQGETQCIRLDARRRSADSAQLLAWAGKLMAELG